MDIIIKNIRIKNFRSLENIDLELGLVNILIGQNNAGKSNLLKAIDIVFNGSKVLFEDDIYISYDEHLSKEKTAIIDVKICPQMNGEIVKHFSDFWTGVFTGDWITVDETDGDYVGIRTIIQYDTKRNDYIIIRKQITQWNETIEAARLGKKQRFNSDMNDFINSFYMDAHRDVTEDIRNRKSYFGRATSNIDLSEEQVALIEEQLDAVNREIVSNISAINETKQNISKIGKTLGNVHSSLQIEPVSRKLSDLHKGMDITFQDGNAATFSVSQHGMGTRSWISFLTLGAYVEYAYKSIKEIDEDADEFVILSLEEPEAHLHPQAQRQIFQQLCEFRGQKIVSTHAPSVLAQAGLESVIQFKKKEGKTLVNRFDAKNYTSEEIAKIEREVVKTHGELIFSSSIVLCEGITEEQALPIYFREFFGIDPTVLGISIIGIGGQNYKTYLHFIKEFDIGWYIFSDGEKEAKKTVRKAVSSITEEPCNMLENVFIIENGYDIEKMLIKNGNQEDIINAINSVNGKKTYYNEYVEKLNGKPKTHRVRTDKPKCPECNQYIYEDVEEGNEEGLNTEETYLYRCMTSKDGKARYATAIAQHIVENREVSKRFPDIILKLLIQIEKDYGIERRSEYSGLKVIRKTETDC